MLNHKFDEVLLEKLADAVIITSGNKSFSFAGFVSCKRLRNPET